MQKQKLRKALEENNPLPPTMTEKDVVEAALFIATKPLMMEELMRVSGVGSLGYLNEVLEALKKEYENGGIEIISRTDGWQMQVKPALLHRVGSLTPYSDLPDGPKRTLAMIVYKEPLKQSELIKSQGNKAYAYIKELREKGMIKAEKSGRTKILSVTKEFEAYFGQPKEIIRQRIADGLERLKTEEKKLYEEKKKPIDVDKEDLDVVENQEASKPKKRLKRSEILIEQKKQQPSETAKEDLSYLTELDVSQLKG